MQYLHESIKVAGSTQRRIEGRAIKEENPTYEELKEWYTMSGLPLKKVLQYQWYDIQTDEPEGQTKRNDRR